MKRVKVFFVVFVAIAMNIACMSAAKPKAKAEATPDTSVTPETPVTSDKDAVALLGIGAPLTLNAVEKMGEENLANTQFIISKRVLMQFKGKLPPRPDGEAREKTGIWRGAVINRGTQGILHPASASIREEVSSDGVLKIIRVLFDRNNPSSYLEFGAWADEPNGRFELITYTGNKVLFGMSDLIKDLEDLKGLSWTEDEPQFTASWSGRELPYLQFQSYEEAQVSKKANKPVEDDEDPQKVDRGARKVPGASVNK